MARVGRPPLFNNCLDLMWAIDSYFETCDDGEVREVYDAKAKSVRTIAQRIPYTMAGLAVALGFSSVESLANSTKIDREAKKNGEQDAGWFCEALKRAKTRIEDQRTVRMLTGEQAAVPSIFDLKNNFGWKDKHEVASDSSVTLVWGNSGDDGLPGED